MDELHLRFFAPHRQSDPEQDVTAPEQRYGEREIVEVRGERRDTDLEKQVHIERRRDSGISYAVRVVESTGTARVHDRVVKSSFTPTMRVAQRTTSNGTIALGGNETITLRTGVRKGGDEF